MKRAPVTRTGLDFHEVQQTGPACCQHSITTFLK